MKLTLLGVVVVSVCSCSRNSSFTLDSFHKLPREMDSMMEGCGCTFAATDLDKGNYLFESNFDSVACISVGGRPVILTLDHTDQYRRKIDDKETGDNSFVNFEAEDYNATYTNDQYKLTIKAKITKEAWEESESFGYKGEMKLENKKGKVITRKIVGTCEC